MRLYTVIAIPSRASTDVMTVHFRAFSPTKLIAAEAAVIADIINTKATLPTRLTVPKSPKFVTILSSKKNRQTIFATIDAAATHADTSEYTEKRLFFNIEGPGGAGSKIVSCRDECGNARLVFGEVKLIVRGVHIPEHNFVGIGKIKR